MKTVFIRNDKNDTTVQEKWVTQENCKLSKQINSRKNQEDLIYQNVQKHFVEETSTNVPDIQILSFNNDSKNKDQWTFNNEARNTRQTKTLISCLKNLV